MSAAAQIYSELPLVKKEVDDVMGGAADWENAPKADGSCVGMGSCAHSGHGSLLRELTASTALRCAARCPKCEHTRAYYFQVQIRSADEPMTTFYKCVSCGNRWNDNS